MSANGVGGVELMHEFSISQTPQGNKEKKYHQMTCSQGYTLKKILLRTCPLTKWGGADGSTLYATISTRENTKICFQRTLSGRGKFFLETKTSTGEHKKCILSDMSANDVGCRSFFIQPLRENKNNIFWSDYQLIFFFGGERDKKKLGGAAWLKHYESLSLVCWGNDYSRLLLV